MTNASLLVLSHLGGLPVPFASGEHGNMCHHYVGMKKSPSLYVDAFSIRSNLYQLALPDKGFAYDDAIKDVVRRATPQQPIERIELNEEYLKSAGHHARERVLAAGLRLAAALENVDDEK